MTMKNLDIEDRFEHFLNIMFEQQLNSSDILSVEFSGFQELIGRAHVREDAFSKIHGYESIKEFENKAFLHKEIVIDGFKIVTVVNIERDDNGQK